MRLLLSPTSTKTFIAGTSVASPPSPTFSHDPASPLDAFASFPHLLPRTRLPARRPPPPIPSSIPILSHAPVAAAGRVRRGPRGSEPRSSRPAPALSARAAASASAAAPSPPGPTRWPWPCRRAPRSERPLPAPLLLGGVEQPHPPGPTTPTSRRTSSPRSADLRLPVRLLQGPPLQERRPLYWPEDPQARIFLHLI